MSVSKPRATLRAAALSVSLLLIVSSAAAAPQYHVVDLGTMGGTTSSAFGINNSGQVVGTSHLSGNPDPRAFRTQPNAVINPATDDVGEYPDPINDVGSTGNAINASGQVVGNAGHAYRTGPNGTVQSGTNLGTLPGATQSNANGINDSGQVVGLSLGPTISHAFRTTASGPITPGSDLGTLGGTFSSANDINNSGEVVGVSTTPTSGTNFHGFRTAPNAAINPTTDDIGTLGGDFTDARAVNNSGQIVGFSKTVSGVQHAFLTGANEAIDPLTDDLGTLGGSSSDAFAVNSSGWVVGDSFLPSNIQVAFLFDGSSMTNLNIDSDATALGWQLTLARGINDSGQIVGEGTIGGVTHAFRLDVVPEPATLVLAAIGIVGLAISARRTVVSNRSC